MHSVEFGPILICPFGRDEFEGNVFALKYVGIQTAEVYLALLSVPGVSLRGGCRFYVIKTKTLVKIPSVCERPALPEMVFSGPSTACPSFSPLTPGPLSCFCEDQSAQWPLLSVTL